MKTQYKIEVLDRLASDIRKNVKDSDAKTKILGMIETMIEELMGVE